MSKMFFSLKDNPCPCSLYGDRQEILGVAHWLLSTFEMEYFRVQWSKEEYYDLEEVTNA